jgi:enoyl-CoA hydratase
MAYDNILVDAEGPVGRITLNRPKALNALSESLLRELLMALRDIRRQAKVRCLVITGTGDKAFCAGADIAAMVEMSAIEARHFSKLGHRAMHALEELSIPVIAAVNGFALGGGLELALACDFIIASANARFGQPEINLGILPGFGGTQRLPRRVGLGCARELIYSGDVIDAAEALRIGLANKVVPTGDLQGEVDKRAAALAGKAPVALGQAKAAINAVADADLVTACNYETEAFAVTFASQDRVEGMKAFLDKRSANFTGR